MIPSIIKIFISSKFESFGDKKRIIKLNDLNRRTIFMYHAISKNLSGASDFEAVKLHVKSIENFWMQNGWNPKTDINFTFDDGYASSLETLHWIASRGYQTTLFISSQECDDYLPKDMLRIIIERLNYGDILNVGPIKIKLLTRKKNSRINLSFKINRYLMEHFSLEDYNLIIDKARNKYNYIFANLDQTLLLLNKNQIIKLISKFPNIKIGAHGSSHYRFDRLLTESEVKREIIDPKNILSSKYNFDIDSIAYPYGFISKENIKIIKKYYRFGYLANYVNRESDYEIPRLGLDGCILEDS